MKIVKEAAESFRTTPLTSMVPDLRSSADWIACAPPEMLADFLSDLDENEVLALPWLFDFWAMPHQLPPEGDWLTWVIMGGRGSGKTRAGAEWIRSEVEGNKPLDPGRSGRIALVGETYDQVRDVMIEGESGILASTPPDRRPKWVASRRLLEWPNGAVAQTFSAHDPEALRGPQFDAAWVDELAKWKRSEETWDMLQFALRLGQRPRQVVTTTPKNVHVLKAILANKSTVSTHATTRANRAHLAQSFLNAVEERYAGTRIGRQELDGELLEDAEGALWTSAALEAERLEETPALDRVVVAVDPPVTGHKTSDACGIVVVGAQTKGPPQNWRAVVLEDATVSEVSPQAWAQTAVNAMIRHGADRLVAEVNQGGDLVETLVRSIDPLIPYRGVRASKGKVARAEPVAALYEQGRVAHLRGLTDLEDEMCRMTARGYEGSGSPDRVDALVWALHELMIDPAAHWRRPQMRVL